MAGLRQKQKTDRDRRIVDAAARLFAVRGYESVKMEEIALKAEVSVGTVYNYFHSKGDLLTAIVARAVQSMIDEGEEMIAEPAEDIGEAINGLLFSYLDKCLTQLTKEMWRRAMVQSIVQPDCLNGRRCNELDSVILDQVCRMLERLHALGRLRDGVCPRDLGEMFFHSMNNQFYSFARFETMTLASYKADVARQNRVLIEAIRR